MSGDGEACGARCESNSVHHHAHPHPGHATVCSTPQKSTEVKLVLRGDVSSESGSSAGSMSMRSTSSRVDIEAGSDMHPTWENSVRLGNDGRNTRRSRLTFSTIARSRLCLATSCVCCTEQGVLGVRKGGGRGDDEDRSSTSTFTRLNSQATRERECACVRGGA
jgi:hypothetical protein